MNAYVDTRDLSALTESFAPIVEALLEACEARGAKMMPFFTMRGPAIQAKLWCQSRTPQEILRQADLMRKAGAPWLASLMRPEFSSRGAHVTHALPGLSWHQWGEAVDCFVVGAKGEAIWNAGNKGYKVYAEEAAKLGLEAGLYWKRLKDAVHVQQKQAGSPLSAGKRWPDIDTEMILRYRV